MSDARSLTALQQFVHRESNSLLQYMVGAFPWTTAERTEALRQLQAVVLEERGALARLVRYLYRHKIPPPRSGGYHSDFTSLNFIDLNHLVLLLIQRQKESIASLESDLPAISDEEGRKLAEIFLDLKKRHLETLQQLLLEPAVMP